MESTAMSARGARRWLRLALLVIGNALVLVILLALVEGLASLSLLAITVKERLAVAERLHTTYDRELGWPAVHLLFKKVMWPMRRQGAKCRSR
jgi:hypothetical protein